MQVYTVKTTMPTGKTDPKFGTEFYVQFNEDERAFPLWYKEAPAVGKTQEGEIINGKFKKAKKEWKPTAEATDTPTTSTKPAWKDNSDGMRQGMCFNNAANYVNTLEFPQPLTDSEWADTVFAYAQALYRKGDLSVAPEGSQDTDESMKDKFKSGN